MEPVQQFRGVTAPAELFDLVAKGIITDSEAWLALTVDSYVNSRGEGCWASNDKLAGKTHKTVRQVQRNLQHLIELKILFHTGWKIVGSKRMRLLETKWSRIDVCTDDTNVMGVNRITDDTNVTCHPCHPRSNGSSSKDEKYERGVSRHPVPPIPAVNGKDRRTAETWLAAAQKLKDSLIANRRVFAKDVKKSAEGFRLLTEEDLQDFSSILDWYCQHCSLADQKEFDLPSIEDGRQFRSHYNWILSRKLRSEPKEEDVRN